MIDFHQIYTSIYIIAGKTDRQTVDSPTTNQRTEIKGIKQLQELLTFS